MIVLLQLPISAPGYVTSATLEFSNTQPAKIFLNGDEIRNLYSKDIHFSDYSLICSADGGFPLESLNSNGTNVLAFQQTWAGGIEPEHHYMGLSYRLTLIQSTGERTIILSEPSTTKFLHFGNGQKPPENWFKPEADDSKWLHPKAARFISDHGQWAEMPLGTSEQSMNGRNLVQFLSHDFNGNASSGITNVFRSTFSINSEKGNPKIRVLPDQPNMGEKITVRIVPDSDVAVMGKFKILAQIPSGTKFDGSVPTASSDLKSGKISWQYGPVVRSLTLQLGSVLENDGFVLPQMALGPWIPDRITYKTSIRGLSLTDFWNSTTFPSGASCWFQISSPQVNVHGEAPMILGVTFQSEIYNQEFEQIMLNYSVDRSAKGALDGKGFNIAHANHHGCRGTWINGYYDATRDRSWTWDDLKNLRVKFEAKQNGKRTTENRLLRCIVSVQYYDQMSVSPYFYATINKSGCGSVSLSAAVISVDNSISSSAEATAPINQSMCPTPTTKLPVRAIPPVITLGPTAIPTVRPTQVKLPSRSGRTESASTDIRVGDVSSSPEPFRDGGAYISFTLKNAGIGMSFLVFDASGRQVAQRKLGNLRAGKNRFLFEGLDDKGRILPRGRYQFKITGLVGNLRQENSYQFRKE